MKYTVNIHECVGDNEDHARQTWHYFDGLSLAQAWRIVEKHVRRGRNRFGGDIMRLEWGARGGDFPHNYRSAIICVDSWERPNKKGMPLGPFTGRARKGRPGVG